MRTISALSAHIKALEAELRDVRQRLEKFERNISMEEFQGTSSPVLSNHMKEIEPIAKELVMTIESAETVKVNPLNLFAIPEVPEKILKVKKVLDQFGY